MVDHAHMLRSVPLQHAVSQVLGYQGQKCDPLGQHFWARGFWVSSVGHNEAAVRKYIQEQEKEDQRLDQLGLFESQSRFERFTISSLRHCRRSLTGSCSSILDQ